MKTKHIWILTLFPEYFLPLIEWGVVGKVLKGERALDSGQKIELHLVRMGDFCHKGHKGLDDAPYGGGPGMLMRADRLKEVLSKSVFEVKGIDPENWKQHFTIVYTSPRGKLWNHQVCQDLAQELLVKSDKDLVFICGRYEGVDERFLQKYVDIEISLGDFVLSGGELAVMVYLDSMIRLLEGTLGDKSSLNHESFSQEILEGPQFTRPAVFEGLEVPEILRGGHDAKISQYRLEQAQKTTEKWRPDLIKGLL